MEANIRRFWWRNPILILPVDDSTAREFPIFYLKPTHTTNGFRFLFYQSLEHLIKHCNKIPRSPSRTLLLWHHKNGQPSVRPIGHLCRDIPIERLLPTWLFFDMCPNIIMSGGWCKNIQGIKCLAPTIPKIRSPARVVENAVAVGLLWSSLAWHERFEKSTPIISSPMHLQCYYERFLVVSSCRSPFTPSHFQLLCVYWPFPRCHFRDAPSSTSRR